MFIGNNVKKYRKENGISQQKLAELIGKSKSSIEKYESGKTNIPMDVLKNIAAALGVTVQELITGQKQHIKVIEKDITDFSTEELMMELYRRIEKD